MTRFSLLIVVLFLYSCGSIPDNDAAKNVAAMFKSDGYSLKKGVEKTSKGTVNVVKFSIKNITVPKGQYEPQRFLSAIALAYYQSISRKERQETNLFKIGIENKGTTISQSFESGDLFIAENYIKIVDDFFTAINKRDSIMPIFDTTYFPDSTKSRIITYMYNQLPVGETYTSIYNGYGLNTIKETGETVITYWAAQTDGKTKYPYQITISKKTNKIISLSVNYGVLSLITNKKRASKALFFRLEF